MSLARTLDDEFKRVAPDEDVPMADLVEEVARLAGVTARSIYNYRTSKWAIPAHLIPVFCKRFKSRALLHALIAEVEHTPVQVPDQYDLTRLTTEAVRDAMKHYQLVLEMFDDKRIEPAEVDQLRQSTEATVQTLWAFLEIAESARARSEPVARKAGR